MNKLFSGIPIHMLIVVGIFCVTVIAFSLYGVVMLVYSIIILDMETVLELITSVLYGVLSFMLTWLLLTILITLSPVRSFMLSIAHWIRDTPDPPTIGDDVDFISWNRDELKNKKNLEEKLKSKEN